MATVGAVTFQRYVALGDSFTEGVGDPDPARPNGLRGWADRVAEVLTVHDAGLGYANLAIRGRKVSEIIAEQIDPAVALAPDLVTIHGGGNDVLRPKVDLDAIAEEYERGIEKLVATGATVAMFTIFDPGPGGIYGAVRGRMAIFNEHMREISERHGALLVDQWRMRHVELAAVMDDDRMHMNHVGHTLMAGEVLKVLGVSDPRPETEVPSVPVLDSREQLRENARWVKEFLGPWVQRRVTGRSSGDSISPKRPTLAPIAPAPVA